MFNLHRKRLYVNWTVYVSVNYDSSGIFLFNSMKKSPELYRKYEAYVIASERNLSARFHFNGFVWYPVIVEVSELITILYRIEQ